MNEEALEEIQKKKKVSDRLTANPEDNSYIQIQRKGNKWCERELQKFSH